MNLRAVATIQLDQVVVTTTGAGTEVNLQKYFVNPGKREMKALFAAMETVSSDSGSLTYKLQESNTTVDSDFSDISGAAFTAIQDSDSSAIQTLHFFTKKQYVRGYRTVVGGTDWVTIAAIFAVKRDA
jgi:hypothetical protein